MQPVKSRENIPSVPSAGNMQPVKSQKICPLCQARENMQPVSVPSAGKRATCAKRRKTR